MRMIPQDIIEMQESIAKVFCGIPAALFSDRNCIYILIKDISEELENFIFTGMTEAVMFETLSREDMEAMAECCKQHGLALAYRSQRMEYMHRKVTVTYPQISNNATGMKVLLIPWFTLSDRPYPVFTYIYAIWHYNNGGKKSQRLSAAAAGKVFGINTFNKSTVCRNIKALEGLFENVRIDRPMPDETAKPPSNTDVIGHIPKILQVCTSIELLKEMLGDNIVQLPDCVNRTKTVKYTPSAIPQEYSKVIIEAMPAGNRRRDTRKRPARPRKRPANAVQRNLRFTDSAKIEHIRKAFIVICRCIAMDSATAYHKLLL